VGRVSGIGVNQSLASAVVERLLAVGVRTFCVCPGGRNAPLVEVLETLPAGRACVLSFFDERSAAFFALGRARRDRSPAAVVTTSGTAAAELLPAMVEAFYASVPLVAVTADRPRAYRGTGAPQAVEQVGMFGVYAPVSVDIEDPGDRRTALPTDAPSHVNVCFAEPLLDGWADDEISGQAPAFPASVAERGAGGAMSSAPAGDVHEALELLRASRQPLVLVGGLQDRADSDAALAFCRELDAPVAAEASSGIREALGPILLATADMAIQRGCGQRLFDAVIRIGDVPSFRVWRDLDLAFQVPVLSVSRKRWRGLTRGVHVEVPPGERLIPRGLMAAAAATRRPGAGDVGQLFEWDRRVAGATDVLLDAHPRSEQAIVRQLSERIPEGACVYLGNSLPIREWNQFATLAPRGFAHGENRGANGIDGQVSSFLGWARPGTENWAVVGDLTALYDLSSLWALRHLATTPVRLVVINNGGGRIFKRMFRNERFQNQHRTGFDAWSAMWETEYHAELPDRPLGPSAVIELRPDETETDAVWTALGAEAKR
jgi:2-succinyl-5-enolpyruvyl-6-hydroxy-3-cyclohexene-1-carboxylate synthase